MALTALAVVSREGTPLYMRDYADGAGLAFDPAGGLPGESDDDIFGDETIRVEETTPRQEAEWPCKLKNQFALHSARQRLDEVLGENRWKAPGASGMDACWVGFLCMVGGLRAYGYVSTNARYVALVEDSIENPQLQKSRDGELCVLLANAHRLYTESLLNPFTSPHSKITSKRFDSSLSSLVQGFNGR